MSEPIVAPEPPLAMTGRPPASPEPGGHSHRAAPDRTARLGWIALTLAAFMAVVEAAALLVDGPGRYPEATVLALVADAVSLAAVVVGIVALVRGGSRAAAAIGIAIALLGNPLVLLYGLGALA